MRSCPPARRDTPARCARTRWNPFTHPLRRRANGTRSAVVTVPAGSTLHFRCLAEGGMWFDDETVPASGGPDVAITV
ncbi:MAG: hypothetical protein M3Y33_05250 [Actinomycetota bacterium]|nr:hypothetical protein [Actinomycetota bacterium]